MVRLIFFFALMSSACGYALFRGRTDARIVSAVFLAGTFATWGLRSSLSGAYSSVELGIFGVDIACLAAFAYAAMISDRFWPLWVSGFQLTTILGHLFKAIDSQLLPLAYAAALRFWGYPILIVLAVGVWRSQRRLRRERLPAST
jgi:hypothetical protein